MRTNFQMVRDLYWYEPENSGTTSMSEIKMLREHFGLDEMTKLELQNLRDMVVIMYSNWTREARSKNDWDEFDSKQDAMQSIVAVIDLALYGERQEIYDLI